MNEALFFLQMKKIINYTLGAALLQKNGFVADITFTINNTQYKVNNFVNESVTFYSKK